METTPTPGLESLPNSADPLSKPPIPEAPGPLRRIFWGPNGLRALWRLLIFIGMVGGVMELLHLLLRTHGMQEFTAKTVIVMDGISFLIVLGAALIMARFEKRSLADYGLTTRGAFGARFFEGILWGFVAECVTMGTLYLTGNMTLQGFEQRGASALYYAAMWGVAFVIVGFFEEFSFRGYLQYTLASGIGFWPAAFLLSGLFWLGHMGNPGETWVGGLATAMAGLIFCVSLWLTGNLWFAIGMHAGWDWTETYFFGVADSGMPANGHLFNTTLSGSKWMTGGTVGPEGSVVELVVTLIVIALLFARFRRSAVPRPPAVPVQSPSAALT